MKILSLMRQTSEGKIDGCAYYRQWMPNKSISDINQILQINTLKPLTDEKIKDFDVFQIIRHGFEDMQRAKKLGLKIIFDIDDYWILDSWHELNKQYKETNYTSQVLSCLEIADVVTTTNEFLAEKCLKYNKNTIIIPNRILTNDKQWHSTKTQSNLVRIGFVGGRHHVKDCELIEKSMAKLYCDKELEGKFIVAYFGWSNQTPENNIAKALSGGGVAKQTQFITVAPADIHTYATFYDNVDIALAPLVDTTFNRCKSNLKIIEAGAKQCAVVASDIPNFAGVPGVIYVKQNKSHKGFYKSLKDLILNESERKERSKLINLHFEENYNLEKNNTYRNLFS